MDVTSANCCTTWLQALNKKMTHGAAEPLVDMTTPESAIQDKQAKQIVLAQTMQSRVILGK